MTSDISASSSKRFAEPNFPAVVPAEKVGEILKNHSADFDLPAEKKNDKLAIPMRNPTITLTEDKNSKQTTEVEVEKEDSIISSLEKKTGFYQVQKEDDLKASVHGLNTLFNHAIAIEEGDFFDPLAKKPASSVRVKKPVEKSVKEKHFMLRAIELTDDESELLEFLKSPETLEAVKSIGICMEDLFPKDRSQFEREEKRAWKISPEIADMRYAAYEKLRKMNLQSILLKLDEMSAEKADSPVKRQKDLTEMYEGTLNKERKRLLKMVQTRAKYEQVIEREATRLKQKRLDFLQHQEEMAKRDFDIIQQKNQLCEIQAQRSGQNREKMERVRQQKGLLEKSRVEMALTRRRYIESRMEEKERENTKKNVVKKEREQEQELKRRQCREEVKILDRNRAKEQYEIMLAKNKHIEEVKKKKQLAIEILKEEKRLNQEERLNTVKQIRNAKKHKNFKTLQKLTERYNRIEDMKELKEEIYRERGKIVKNQLIKQDKWKQKYESANPLPGPGEYEAASTLKSAGGTWGHYKPKSDIEWRMRMAAEIPGPGEYEVGNLNKGIGGSFSRQLHKTTTEMLCEKAQSLPGPGQYECNEAGTKSTILTTIFAKSEASSQLELELKKAAEMPSCCDYSPTVVRNKRLKSLATTLTATNQFRKQTAVGTNVASTTNIGCSDLIAEVD